MIEDKDVKNGPQFDPITSDEVKQEIQQLGSHKSGGPSGIGPTHLKYLCRMNPKFINNLAEAFNQLYNDAEKI